MSDHKKPQSHELVQALKDHGLAHDKPSQLADAFRAGWEAARRAPVVPQALNVTEEMHVAAVKVLHRASGVDGLPQRIVDAMLAAAPQSPKEVCYEDFLEKNDHMLRGI